jgi:glycosyltransferase involved in cell wall biosynthesis
MGMIDVSVVLPVHDRPQFLMPAIDSVLAQAAVEFELLVVDDGSGEATQALLDSIRHPAVHVLRRAHVGIPGAVRNAGIRAARGRYVAFLDSDDVWRPDKLRRQLESLRASAAARWSYTGCAHIDAAGRPFAPAGIQPWRPHEGPMAEAVGCLRAHAALPSVMAERALLLELQGFDETLPLYEDYELWLRLALHSEPAVAGEPLVYVRRHDAHYSGRDALREAECRAEFLDRAWRALSSRDCRAELRSIRALHAAKLARLHAELGHVAEARASLRASLGAGFRHARWWSDALRCLRSGWRSEG